MCAKKNKINKIKTLKNQYKKNKCTVNKIP